MRMTRTSDGPPWERDPDPSSAIEGARVENARADGLGAFGPVAAPAPTERSAKLRLVGIDEAGLGPLLGPLCLAAVTLDVPPHASHHKPPRLASLFDFDPPGGAARPARLIVADSKEVFVRPDGHARAEETVLTWLDGALPTHPEKPRDAVDEVPSLVPLLGGLDGETLGSLRRHPWYAGFHERPPHFTASDSLRVALGRLRWMRVMGTLPCWPRPLVRVIDETRFNEAIARHDNKAHCVWEHVSALLRGALGDQGPERFRVVVDRLGGRKFYADGLERLFPGASVRKHQEVRGDSAYRVRLADGREGTIAFRVGADRSSFPVAMASMFAKYLREVAMAKFNEYFARRVPHVRPTKGYVQDARRWIVEMTPHLERLGIPLERLVRVR